MRNAKNYFKAITCSVLVVASSYASAADKQFQPERFFAGHTRSKGVFENTVGKARQQFTTDCHGIVRGDILALAQQFRYGDGHTQQRHWQIRRLDSTHYEGRAEDVVGVARGAVVGNAFHFSYVVAAKPGNPLFNVELDQTMTLRRDGVLENHATIRKLGFTISRVTEFFRRAD